MRFFDTHLHLDYLAQALHLPSSQLVEQADAQGVKRLLVVSVFTENFAAVTACQRANPDQVVYALGLHPLYIRQHRQEDLDTLEQHLQQRDPALTALGEIGLEKAVEEVCTPTLWQKQCDFLEAQLALAKQYHLPVNLHSRKSHDALSPFLRRADLPLRGVIHGFAGSYAQAKRFVDLGYYIGVGGTITYQRANKTREAIRKLPLDSLLLETDSPDMPVFGFQGQANRPERLKVSFYALCALRTEPPEQIAEQIWQQSHRLFWSKK